MLGWKTGNVEQTMLTDEHDGHDLPRVRTTRRDDLMQPVSAPAHAGSCTSLCGS